jgi:hypothetical protein
MRKVAAYRIYLLNLLMMCKVAAYRIFVRIIVNAQGCRIYLLELFLMRKVAAYIC